MNLTMTSHRGRIVLSLLLLITTHSIHSVNWTCSLYGSELAEAALRAGEGEFQPVTEKQLDSARIQLLSELNQLDRFLSRGGPDKRDGWRRYLRFEQLEQLLRDDASPDLNVLHEAAGQYYSGYPGLELPEFARVRRVLTEFLYLTEMAASPEANEKYESEIESLAQAINALAEQYSAQVAKEVGIRVRRLEILGRNPQLVASVRKELSRPNMFFVVDEKLVNDALADPIAEPIKIRDRILGTDIRGTGFTEATIQYDFVSHRSAGLIDVGMNGHTTSDTIGRNGPARIFNSGITKLNGTKRIIIDTHGLTSEDATAKCRTRTRIKGIGAKAQIGRKIIRKIAAKRARQLKGQADCIASRHAEKRLARRMNRQAKEMLGDVNRRYHERVVEPLEKWDLFPSDANVSTSDDQLTVVANLVRRSQLSATTDPPDAVDGQLSMRIHSSIVQNIAETLLSGMTLTDERLVELLRERDIEVPEELRIRQDKDPWSITFLHEVPLRMTVDDGLVTIAIRCRQLTRGDNRMNRLVDIAAQYRLRRDENAIIADRVGDVEVTYVGHEGRQSVGQISFRTLLVSKFGSLFKETFTFAGGRLPENAKKLGPLDLVHLAADNGWLSFGWNKNDETRTNVAVR